MPTRSPARLIDVTKTDPRNIRIFAASQSRYYEEHSRERFVAWMSRPDLGEGERMGTPVYAVSQHTDLATRVLLVDDDADTLKLMGDMLRLEGYMVTACLSAREAIQRFEALDHHIVILDMRMPSMDGVAACRVLRRMSDVPILMLSGLDDEWDAAHALESGADDYIRKPIGPSEFVARVRAALRRSTMVASVLTDSISIGHLVIDVLEHEVRVDGRSVGVTPLELKLLTFLALSQGHVLTHDNTLAAVWGAGYAGSRHVLRVTMSRLRLKLKLMDSPSVSIDTVEGVGYRLMMEDDLLGPATSHVDAFAQLWA